MLPKATTKKKEMSKSSSSYLNHGDDDEIKAEIEAMTGLEYNLFTDKTSDNPSISYFSTTKKTRNASSRELSTKQEKSAIQSEKQTKERIEMESHIPFYSSNASVRELQNIVRQAGSNSEDKYKILEARDRLMRHKKVKTHTLDAKVTRGTCPDMCPEKERLMREFQRQVSLYELQDSAEYKICHKTAVKQYSRSSADQEEPMPQDLRPVSSLKMTMSYLLHEITDLCEEEGTNLADWYHFLWDRTRGIRKDITQQELCDLETVQLLEQCARFHILCSERLCAEESSVFDKKINTENLTKCLQTLKYMYYDLRVEGITCKNEPEFRAYIILLNLNNANFMWDLQRLPSAIQKSAQVKYAIQVYSSIQSNNYTKFFKLVRVTTYLNACILLRYFFQVRSAALSVMLKAYCRTTSTLFPLYEFIDILGFDDESEAIYFCEQAGLNISNDELHVILNRQNASLPPPLIDQGRAKNLVEAKRLKKGWSIGQSIAGGELPVQLYLNHKPHNSFDDYGYLKPEALNASDQNKGILNEELINDEDDDQREEDMEDEEEDMEDEEGEVEDEEQVEEEQEEENEQDLNEYMDEEIHDLPSSLRTQPSSLATRNHESHEPTVKSLFSSVNFTKEQPSDNIFRKSTFSFAKPSISQFSFSSAKSNDKDLSMTSAKSITPSTGFVANSQFSFNKVNSQPNIFSKSKVPNIFETTSKTSPFNNASPFSSVNASNHGIFSTISQPVAVTTPMSTLSNFSVSTKVEENVVKIPKSIEPTVVNQEMKINADNQAKIIKKEQEEDTRKILEIEIEQKQIIKKIEENSVKITEQVGIDVIHDICSTILKQELEKMRVYDNLSKKVLDDILNDFIHENSKIILDEELHLQESLKDVANRIKVRSTIKYYKLWRQYVSKKQKQRRALESTPVWLPKRSIEESVMSLYRKDQDLVIQNMRRKSLKSHNEDTQMNYLVPIEIKIYDGLKKNLKNLNIDSKPIMFWKMVISWPLLDNRVLLWRYKKVVCQYLCPTDFTIDPIIKSFKPNPYETLNICIKQTEGFIADHHLVGVDGLFFIATTDEDPKSVAKRLTKTVLSRQKMMPIPLVFLIFGQPSLKKVEPIDELENLLQSGYISEYTVHHEEIIDEATILRLTQTAIFWMTLNKSAPIPLEMACLREIIETCLTEELWLRISGHGSFNPNLDKALPDVKFIIDLHNEAVDHLIDIILDPESLLYTDFPPEFKRFLRRDFELPCSYEYFDKEWKKEDNRAKVEAILSNFILPQWPFQWPIKDTMEFHNAIISYCRLTLKEASYDTISCNILSKLFFISDDEQQPNFIHVLLEILKAKIGLINFPVHAVYNKNHVKDFRTLPWWFESIALIRFNVRDEKCVNQKYLGEPVEKKRRLGLEEENQNVSRIIEEYDSICEIDKPVEIICQETHNHFHKVRSVSDKLDELLAQQQMSSRKFEQRLEAALRDSGTS